MTNTPKVGDMVQDKIGHWYKILEVQGGGWRFKVEMYQEVGGKLYALGYKAVTMGRSELRID